jgi:hypothetical protein
VAKGGRRTAAAPIQLESAFFKYLWNFYRANRASIRRSYKDLTQRFLDHNDPSPGKRPEAYLRVPQFEALEMYVFLKEYTGNARVADIFNRWYHKRDGFEKRSGAGLTTDAQMTLGTVTDQFNEAAYKSLYDRMASARGIDAASLQLLDVN